MIPSINRLIMLIPKSRIGFKNRIITRYTTVLLQNLENDPRTSVLARSLHTEAPTMPVTYYQRRFKHKKRGAKSQDDDDDDDDYDSDEEVEEPGSKIITGHMASLRADLVLKSGLGIARNKVETLFYESKVRVNGAKIPKKSQKVYIGDELDVIKGPSPVNENMTIVSRVVVLSAKEHDDGDKLVVKMRRYKSLAIEAQEYDIT